MKILIGTPVHQSKDYSLKRWLKSVSKISYPADLLIVDDSPGKQYSEKIKTICNKYNIKNYSVKHLESINQGTTLDDKDSRIETAQKLIKDVVIKNNYDAWFSWESDVILPPDALGKLVKIMEAGSNDGSPGFSIVAHNCSPRGYADAYSADFEITLISRECLEKYGSLLSFVTRPDYRQMTKKRQQSLESNFQTRVLQKGGNYIRVYNLISPIYHLEK